jgi:hypothetical protein
MSYVYIYIQDFKLEYFQHIRGTYYGKNFITFSKIQKMICLYHNFFPKFVFYNFCRKISIFFPNSVLTLHIKFKNSPQKENDACDPLLLFLCICDIFDLLFKLIAFYFYFKNLNVFYSKKIYIWVTPRDWNFKWFYSNQIIIWPCRYRTIFPCVYDIFISICKVVSFYL